MNILMIGAGNMAQALFAPLKEMLNQHKVFFYTPSIIRGKTLAHTLDQYWLDGLDDQQWNMSFDVVFLAHKPQNLVSVQTLLHTQLTSAPHYMVSILAGVSVDLLRKTLWNIPVLRLMPNTPCLVGEGIITHYASHDLPTDQARFFTHLFAQHASLVPFEDEATFDQVTPILGSGPGVLFELSAILQRELELLGIDTEESKALISKLFMGTALLAQQSPHSFETLKQQVTSPGGITESMLGVMQSKQIDHIFKQAIEAGRQRGIALNQAKS